MSGERKKRIKIYVKVQLLPLILFHVGRSSSDDEEGLLKQQKQESVLSSEDEFEKEMQMELESVMRNYENDHGKNLL